MFHDKRGSIIGNRGGALIQGERYRRVQNENGNTKQKTDNSMTKLPKFFLTLSVTAFALGFATVTSHNLPAAWAVAMPLGAIFLGWFLITFMLQNEVAQFDEETRLQLELAKRNAPAASRTADTRNQPSPARGLVLAGNAR
jgi:hypothetical protein